MKLINTIQDSYYGVVSYIYQFPSGLRVFHAINKNTVDFKLSINFKAGMLLEDQINVPRGTAHFLEHLLVYASNKTFDSRTEMDKFSFGNSKRPAFWFNASSGYRFITFDAIGHNKGADRMFTLLNAQLDYDLEKLFEASEIEKQRSIIISELKRKPREDMDPGLLYDKLFMNSSNPLFAQRSIGTLESVSSITKDHLSLFLQTFFSVNNVVVGIESNSKLTKNLKDKLQKLDNTFSSYKNSFKTDYKFKPLDFDFRYGHFKDIHKQDVFCSFNLFHDTDPTKEVDYKKNAQRFMVLDLVGRVMNEYLREQKMLIYGAKTFNQLLFPGVLNKGFNFNVPAEKLLETFDAIEYVITKYAKEFINSSSGEEFFESMKSKYIFKRDTLLPDTYTEDRACDILNGYFMNNDQDLFEKEILKMTKSDLIKSFESHFKLPSGIWLVSSLEDSEVLKIFETSKLYSFLKNRKH